MIKKCLFGSRKKKEWKRHGRRCTIRAGAVRSNGMRHCQSKSHRILQVVVMYIYITHKLNTRNESNELNRTESKRGAQQRCYRIPHTTNLE
mmetsp:Transcript_2682/g.5500  ORF Transcript_2682/g.5500 Transcript_2682/m.5500 type:complete len:91 (+) Transcript_2682:122-394(+)